VIEIFIILHIKIKMEKKVIDKLPVIDISKCTKCDKCFIICPHSAIVKETSSACARCIKYCISMKVPCNPENYVFCYEKCDMCGLCVSECTFDAIYWHNMIKS
jgi:Pyruvate/2-oxoacid:ferredoxin oxidoreductase delta subunit